MDRAPTPKDLRGGAAVSQTLAYAVGLAGVVAGGLVLQGGDTILAVVAWVLTFAAGAVLMLAATVTRAIAALLERVGRLESDVSRLAAGTGSGQLPEPERDPWGRHVPPV